MHADNIGGHPSTLDFAGVGDSGGQCRPLLESQIRLLVPRWACRTYGVAIGVSSIAGELSALSGAFQAGALGPFSLLSVLAAGHAALFVASEASELCRRGAARGPEDEVLSGVFAAVMVILNAQCYCSLKHTRNRCVAQYTRVTHMIVPEITRYMAMGWFVALLLPRLFVPSRKRPQRQYALGCGSVLLSMVSCCLCLVVMLGNFCFINAWAGGFLSIAFAGNAVLMSNMFQWLATGDGAGCRVFLLPFVMVFLCHSIGRNDISSWGFSCTMAVATAAAALAAAALATQVSERVCSTSKMFLWEPSLARALCCPCFSRIRQWIEDFVPTWRGALVAFCCNGCLSLLVYGPLWKEARFSSDTKRTYYLPFRLGTCEQTRKAIMVMSGFAIFVGVVSLVTDSFQSRRCWQKSLCRCLPVDRHHRVLVALKVGVIWAKMDLLLTFTVDLKRPWPQLIPQMMSILVTSTLAGLNLFKIHGTALDVREEFRETFRAPATLLQTARLATLIWYLGTTLILAGALLDETWELIPSPRRLEFLNLFVVVNSLWVLAANEIALLVSSKRSNPRVFEAIQSPAGLRAILGFCAIAQPYHMLCDVCNHVTAKDSWSLAPQLALTAWSAGVAGVGLYSSGKAAVEDMGYVRRPVESGEDESASTSNDTSSEASSSYVQSGASGEEEGGPNNEGAKISGPQRSRFTL